MLAIIFLFLSFVWGSLCWRWLGGAQDDALKEEGGFSRHIFSLGLGLVVASCAILILALFCGNLFDALIIFAVLSAVFIFYFRRVVFEIFKKFKFVFKKFASADFVLLIIAASVMVLGLQSMLFNDAGYPFGILKGWGDGAYHLDMVRRLATVDPFVLDQPVAGGRFLSYPFLVNFISAILLKIGASLPVAWHLPTMIFNLGLVLGLFGLGKKILVKKHLALAFVFLVLFGAGLGYLRFFREVREDSLVLGWKTALVQNLVEPKYEYSHLDSRTGGKPSKKNTDDNIVWIVPVISFFSHQRSFILGGFLGALFLIGFLSNLRFGSDSESSAGRGGFNYTPLFMLALMPLAHAHSFLALLVLASVLIIVSGRFFEALRDKHVWLSGLVALPQVAYLFLVLRLNGGQNFTPWFGWMACSHSLSWFFCDPGVWGTDSSVFLFWLKNFGTIFAVWLAAIFVFQFIKKETSLLKLSLASIILFMIPNLILLQPWEFDNNKFLFWWWIVVILLSLSLFIKEEKSSEISNFKIPALCQRLWRGEQILNKSQISNLLLAIFVISASFSGIIDVFYRLQSGLKIEENIRNFGYYGETEIKTAEWIKKNTRPNDIFLTSTSPTQFVSMLSGRPIYLGFTGWLWTQGGDDVISDRRQKIRNFVLSGNTEDLCREGVKYWLVDQDFLRDYPESTRIFDIVPRKVFEMNGKKIFEFDCDRD